MLTLLRRAVLFESSRSHPQQLLTAFRAERSLLVDIPTGWEPRTEQQPTGLIAHPAAQGRAVKQSKSEPFPFDAASAASPKVTVCVPSL